MADAIREMHVRGAGLIGAAGGYGMYLAALEAQQMGDAAGFDRHVAEAAALLKSTRPTAVNLAWAIERQFGVMGKLKAAVTRVKERPGLSKLKAEIEV